MGYTTIANVAGVFPTFVRGTAQQKPADTLIQTYIDDVAAEINAVLVRRGFVATGLAAAGIQALLSPDAANICEMINRYGAAAQLGQTLATFGVLSAGTLAKTFADNYQRMKNDLDARDEVVFHALVIVGEGFRQRAGAQDAEGRERLPELRRRAVAIDHLADVRGVGGEQGLDPGRRETGRDETAPHQHGVDLRRHVVNVSLDQRVGRLLLRRSAHEGRKHAGHVGDGRVSHNRFSVFSYQFSVPE